MARHGLSTMTLTYNSWRSMKKRCLWSGACDWDRYGGRGITVCERWLAYANFYEDMGERQPGFTLDRIDPNGNYETENCRWADIKTQNTNKRKGKKVVNSNY